MYKPITAAFTRLVLKLYKTKIYDIHLRLILQTRISYICSTPVLSERNFYECLEMKLTSALGGVGLQRAGTPKTAGKSVTPCFT